MLAKTFYYLFLVVFKSVVVIVMMMTICFMCVVLISLLHMYMPTVDWFVFLEYFFGNFGQDGF